MGGRCRRGRNRRPARRVALTVATRRWGKGLFVHIDFHSSQRSSLGVEVELQIVGLHVHIGVRSPEKVIAISNALLAYVPHFLALSASSPYWLGEDTGLASSRSKVFELLPTAGLPHQMSGWAEFEQFMGTLV